MVQAEHIFLRYGEQAIFEDFSFEAPPHRHTCVHGPSGAGKSTLLKMIQGYILPDQGALWVMGHRLAPERIQALRRRMAWVPQEVNLPVERGAELLEWMGQKDRRPAVEDWLHRLGLAPRLLDQAFAKVSGGQKQRIIIAVGLSLERELLLLDEPTAALDEAAIDHLLEALAAVSTQTVVSVSHHARWIGQADHQISL